MGVKDSDMKTASGIEEYFAREGSEEVVNDMDKDWLGIRG